MLDSPIGVICLAAIIVTSLINIYAHWIEDGLFGRLLYGVRCYAAGGLVHYRWHPAIHNYDSSPYSRLNRCVTFA